MAPEDIVQVIEGNSPLILGQPHVGMEVPPDIETRLNERGRARDDADWHVDRLYDGLAPRASVVRARLSRYVVDLNRDPSGRSLYPGQATTELVPTTDFDGRPIWRQGEAPDADEVAERAARFHAPYHAALAAEIARVREIHGVALLFDCHSIRSEAPRLFEGRLPVFNIGTNDGRTAAHGVEAEAVAACADAGEALGVDFVLNGRFKGGWTTRRYGRPEEGVHAVQLELAQRAYMEEARPWRYLPERAERLRPYLARLLTRLEGAVRLL